MNTKRVSLMLLSLTLSSALLASAAQAHGATGTASDYGSMAPANTATKQIDVSNGKAVNVNEGDTVTFTANGQSFTWNVYTYPNQTWFNLAKIAPSHMNFPSVDVYVGPNPLYIN